jgi:peptidoglycan/xylan/chitin deacetylase (PgdA/CDA1 family)
MFCPAITQTLVAQISTVLRFRLTSMFIGVSMLLYLSSCAPTTAIIQPAEKNFFRSENYIVYGLQDAETPEVLAERFLGDKKKSWVIEDANPNIMFTKGQFIVIPLKERNKGGLSAEGYQTIPILTYHRFGKNCRSVLCTSASVFDFQMRYLKKNGYRVITPEELLAFLEYRHSIPKKSVMITMDDGYRSVYEIAYPILKKYGFTATVFIYTNYVGVSGSAITWDQLREMKANGFTIGSHTMFHSDLTKRNKGETELEFLSRIKKELHGSKKIIDKKMGQKTYFLAYPFGNYDQRAIEIARQAGYKMAMSVKRGGNPFFANPLSLRRDQILKSDIRIFALRLKTFNPLPLE